jgi:hypothetical protein
VIASSGQGSALDPFKGDFIKTPLKIPETFKLLAGRIDKVVKT